jgi:nitronate monooxygenase
LSGAIARGASILAAEVMGADLAYIGSAFIATREANAAEAHKQAIVDGRGEDILGTKYFTGIFGNYLRRSIVAAGLDPDNLPAGEPNRMLEIASGGSKPKAWRDIWGSGQGIGPIDRVTGTAELVERLAREYAAARAMVAAK